METKNNILFILTCLLIMSCGDSSDQRQKRIKTYVDSRLESYKQNKMERCIGNITSTAKKSVDKFITRNEENILSRNKTSDLPPKPQRPNRKRASDSLKIHPIFKSDTL